MLNPTFLIADDIVFSQLILSLNFDQTNFFSATILDLMVAPLEDVYMLCAAQVHIPVIH